MNCSKSLSKHKELIAVFLFVLLFVVVLFYLSICSFVLRLFRDTKKGNLSDEVLPL